MNAATGTGQRHGGIAAKRVGWTVDSGVHAVEDAFARGGLGEGNFAGLLDRVDPFLGAVFASCRVGGSGARVFESQVLVALRSVSIFRCANSNERKHTVSIDHAVRPFEST